MPDPVGYDFRLGMDMSFGKRGDEPGDAPFSVRKVPLVAPSGKKTSSGIDRGFAALALGVVIISAGGAMAAPSVLSWVGASISAGPARPIATAIAGLDHSQAKQILAGEAFPDQEGRAFLTSLAVKFPNDHSRLLDDLAARAIAGGNRDDLMVVLGNWLGEFMSRNLPAIGRTGASGFDQVLAIASDGLGMLEAAGNGNCKVETLQKIASNPAQIADLGAYGSPGYKLSMRASRILVDLAADGRNAGPAATALRREDEQALQSTFFSMMQDPQIMSLIQAGMQSSSSRQTLDSAALSELNVCKLGRTVIVKLKNLPSGTKSRLWGVAMQQAKASL